MTKLGVNIDHIATIRQARHALEPDPVAAAVIAELAGADGITIHLRGDRRHIQDDDVRRLREARVGVCSLSQFPEDDGRRDGLADLAAPAPADGSPCLAAVLTLVTNLQPAERLLLEGGLDILKNRKAVASAIRELQKGRLEISLFIDPDLAQVDAAAELRVPMIELNTRSYAEACPRSPDLDRATVERELNKITAASDRGAGLGLKILAGHGLTYRNVRLISDIADIVELNIGHNIVARAALVGMAHAVKEMLQAMGRH